MTLSLSLIIHLESYNDETLERLMDARDDRGIATHLARWDYGDGGEPCAPSALEGLTGYVITDHEIDGCGTYILVVNYALGDASLYSRQA